MGIGGGISGSGGMHGTSQSGETLKQSVKSEVSAAASVGTTTTHKTTCTPKKGENRAGLWQWVISSEDYSVSAFTPHTICRTGDLAFTEPNCSFWDCKNGNCSECKSITNAVEDILKDTGEQIEDPKDEEGSESRPDE